MHPALGFVVDKMLPGLIGTAVGAWLAFWSKRRLDKHDEEKRHQASGNRTLFILLQYLNTFTDAERLISQWRDPGATESRWFLMPKIQDFSDPPRIPIDEMSFLLELKDPNLLGQLVVAQNRMLTFQGIVRERNRLKEQLLDHLGKQPGIPPEAQVIDRMKFIRAATPFPLWASMDNLVDQILERLPRDIRDLTQTFTDVEKTLRGHWPKARFLKFDKPPEEVHPTDSPSRKG